MVYFRAGKCLLVDDWRSKETIPFIKMAENKVILIYGLLTEQAGSIKNLLYGLRGYFSCGIRRVVPSGQDSSILPTRLANHSARFGSSCPVTEFFFLFLQYAILLSKTLLAYGRRAGNLN